MRKLVVLAVVAVAAAATAGRAQGYRHTAFAQRLANALAAPKVARSRTGAFAFDLRARRVVFEHNSTLPLAPASNEKLAVTYAALVRLGPRYRFHTDVLVARGNLYLRGGGDPTLHVSGLRKLALELRARGVTRIRGDVLADILRFMDRWSDNFTAEMVLKTLGHGTTARGATVVGRTLEQAHVPLRGVRIADGSGLSSRDRFTARALAGILLASWKNPRVRPYVWRALAVAGRCGTLSDRLLGAEGLVRAKTGTTDIASALSGYAGRSYVFAVVQDGSPISTSSAREAQDRFASVLAGAATARVARAGNA
jgi:D-alanyl-D-alanine carboxypeptidase